MDCIVALPRQLFRETQVYLCLCFREESEPVGKFRAKMGLGLTSVA